MKRLLLVRHGESEWNAGRRLQGQADISLSERGRAQAAALRDAIAALAPDRVVTSSLRRARETASVLGFPDAERREELKEIDVGTWTGEFIADLTARDAAAYRGWRAGTHTPPAGETWAAFRARTGGFVQEALAGNGAHLLVVSHGGVIRALLETLLGLPPARIVPVGPGSLTMLRQANSGRRDEVRLEVFNYSPNGLALDAPD